MQISASAAGLYLLEMSNRILRGEGYFSLGDFIYVCAKSLIETSGSGLYADEKIQVVLSSDEDIRVYEKLPIDSEMKVEFIYTERFTWRQGRCTLCDLQSSWVDHVLQISR